MQKILHNDIKCDNVMMYRDGEGLKCVLIDFGKACQIEEGKHKKLISDEKQHTERIILTLPRKSLMESHSIRLQVTLLHLEE